MSEVNNTTNEETMETQAETNGVSVAAAETQTAPAVQLIPESPKKKKGWIWAIVVAVVLVAAVILGVALGRSTPKEKVEEAVKNTFSHKSLLLEEMNQLKKLGEDDYTAGMDITVDGEQIAFEGRLTDEVLQVWAKTNIEDIPEMEFWANLTRDRLEVNISELEDVLFTYKFREPKSGILLEYVTKEDLELIDEMFIQFADLFWGENEESLAAQREEANEKLMQIFLDVYVNMEFEETDSATYEVKGKTQECKGYTSVLASETLRNMMKEIESVYEEYELDYWTEYQDFYEDYYGDYYEDYSVDPFGDMDEALQSIDEMEVIVYLAEKEVAAIVLEIEDDPIEFFFGGGDADTWSMELIYEEESQMKLESKVEGAMETITVEVEDVPVAILTYDSESGRYDLSIEYYMPLLTASGIMEFSETEFTVSAEEITSAYLPYEIVFNYYGKTGAEVKELTGEEFDFTDASEMDVMALYMMLEQTSLFSY
ncbi:MAG: hypothetical protein IJP31_02780 [Lachnospiraceae bacterium]|nr:hypothetical protein [Lachnospiraceae bacterium]